MAKKESTEKKLLSKTTAKIYRTVVSSKKNTFSTYNKTVL